ncbi:MAG: hypothetical protein IPJ65_44185 [Archangiaceae bacterium]|nr:hypothetical protein [Archangiaceae bacterium]
MPGRLALVSLLSLAACGPLLKKGQTADGGLDTADAGTAHGMLSQQGRAVVDETGTPVVLKGANLGGWLMWRGGCSVPRFPSPTPWAAWATRRATS